MAILSKHAHTHTADEHHHSISMLFRILLSALAIIAIMYAIQTYDKTSGDGTAHKSTSTMLPPAKVTPTDKPMPVLHI